MAQQPSSEDRGKGGNPDQNTEQNPAPDRDQHPDPEAANTDETVQAEERAEGGVSGSGNTLGDGTTTVGAENVEPRKDEKQQGPVKIAVAGEEHGDEDATSQ